jgi:ribosomal protein L13
MFVNELALRKTMLRLALDSGKINHDQYEYHLKKISVEEENQALQKKKNEELTRHAIKKMLANNR